MNARDRQILLAALEAAHEADRQLSDIELHSLANKHLASKGEITAGLQEFKPAMEIADTNGWFITVPARFGSGKRWTISSDGEAARIAMARES